jgi:2-keto-4-pentenoate hydratase
LGAKGDPRKLDLTLAGMVLEKNGELFSTGVGAAVQGSPANAVAWLANTLGELGMPFKRRRGDPVRLAVALVPVGMATNWCAPSAAWAAAGEVFFPWKGGAVA